MILTLEMCQNTIRAWKYMGLLMYVLKISVAGIVIVTSCMSLGTVIIKGTQEEITRSAISIAKKIIAAIIIFYVPTVVTSTINLLVQSKNKEEFAACEVCFKDPNNNKCNDFIVAFDKSLAAEAEKFKQDSIKGSVDSCDYGLASPPPLDYSYKGNGTIRPLFSSENMKIVEKHYMDFNYNNFHSYIKSHGGFKKYTEELGGIYKEYFGKTWEGKSIRDVQEASEYVFGYMTMYGFDYFNGRDNPPGGNQKYCKWGGFCYYYKDEVAAAQKDPPETIPEPYGTYDAFYPGKFRYEHNGMPDYTDFDAIIQGDNMTTGCNWTVNMVFWKAGIFKNGTREDGTPEFQTCTEIGKMRKYAKAIEKMCDIRVGDILEFYSQPVDHTDMNTWNGWAHVAYVGEVDPKSGIITAYDGGSYQQMNRNFKWTFKVQDEWPAGLFGYPGWSAVRVKELENY